MNYKIKRYSSELIISAIQLDGVRRVQSGTAVFTPEFSKKLSREEEFCVGRIKNYCRMIKKNCITEAEFTQCMKNIKTDLRPHITCLEESFLDKYMEDEESNIEHKEDLERGSREVQSFIRDWRDKNKALSV